MYAIRLCVVKKEQLGAQRWKHNNALTHLHPYTDPSRKGLFTWSIPDL